MPLLQEGEGTGSVLRRGQHRALVFKESAEMTGDFVLMLGFDHPLQWENLPISLPGRLCSRALSLIAVHKPLRSSAAYVDGCIVQLVVYKGSCQ